MRAALPLLIVLPFLALAGCAPEEEESVEEKFERQESAIQNRARRYEAEADNAVGADEARLEAEAAALRNRADTLEEQAGNAGKAAAED